MTSAVHRLESFIFWSRWLQAPLYVGLILAQGVYVYHFLHELWHLVSHATTFSETQIMLIVLGLIDVVMIANLLVMVVIGGYETFVSKIDSLEKHEDRPEWLSHVNAGVLKTKLSLALISISSIHLLKSFISASDLGSPTSTISESGLLWQVVIHCTFLLSALVMAFTDKLMQHKPH
ncbi:TIGR00645 family protein [Chitinimonas koreensis]|uniref:TIGR00645 family protein n=1 Tax=Chitinimonas koreensis TaxID=356302 RepID=UPI000422B035|nr:TIGR00645 family protein [Chitinimonas koreensis]QNM96925.1 TIGR00645 family protein [Chitinimonas koreensis]